MKLLKEALGLIHDYLEEIQKYSPEDLNEQEDKDKIKIQKYLTYVLDEVSQLVEFFCLLNTFTKSNLRPGL